jgi:hypothetical protein
MSAPQPPPSAQSLFLEASETWDLNKLYGDLEDLKGDRLTTIEAAGLRGLLLGVDRHQIATDLQISPDDLRTTLISSIYPFVAAITGAPHITSPFLRVSWPRSLSNF